MELLGTQLTFEEVYKKRISDTEFARVDHIKVYLGGTPIGTFGRSVANPLRHLFKLRSDKGQYLWSGLSKETRHLIHAEDKGEYVLLWLNDFTGKKPTRREAILIKA